MIFCFIEVFGDRPKIKEVFVGQDFCMPTITNRFTCNWKANKMHDFAITHDATIGTCRKVNARRGDSW